MHFGSVEKNSAAGASVQFCTDFCTDFCFTDLCTDLCRDFLYRYLNRFFTDFKLILLKPVLTIESACAIQQSMKIGHKTHNFDTWNMKFLMS